jgi:anti-anti-sigma factor
MTAIQLPAIMDRQCLAGLASDMLAACQPKQDLTIDGSQVARMGLCGLQLLASAAKTAEAKSAKFVLLNASEELKGAVQLGGLEQLLGLQPAGDAQ